MRLQLNVLPKLKQTAEERVNRYFNQIAMSSTHIDQEYSLKRGEAMRYLDGGSRVFERIAAQEGRDPAELARDIVSRENPVVARGLTRREAVLKIRSATTRAELDAILQAYDKTDPLTGVVRP